MHQSILLIQSLMQCLAMFVQPVTIVPNSLQRLFNAALGSFPIRLAIPTPVFVILALLDIIVLVQLLQFL